MDKKLIKKITHVLFDKKTIKRDKLNHPFHRYTEEDIEDLEYLFQRTDKYSMPPSSEIFMITTYLNEKKIIDFIIDEKENTDEAWFEVLIFKKIGIRKRKPLHLYIIWDGACYLDNINSIEEFIKRIAKIQKDINETKFFNNIKKTKNN